MSSLSYLVSVTSLAILWGGIDASFASQSTADISNHPDVFEPPVQLRNIYPAENFNRDVTTTWWQPSILDGHDATRSKNLSALLKAATYIVLDKEMYTVCNKTS